MIYDRRSCSFFLKNSSCIEPLKSLRIFLPDNTSLLSSISFDMANHLLLFLRLIFRPINWYPKSVFKNRSFGVTEIWGKILTQTCLLQHLVQVN